MKTKRKDYKEDALEAVIKGAAAGVETAPPKKRGPGRKKSEVEKEQFPLYFPLNITAAIRANSQGNNSVFVETIIKEYFDKQGIEY